MKNAQKIFTGRFKHAKSAIFQRCSEINNTESLTLNYTEHWPILPANADVIALSIVKGNKKREIWAGRVIDQQPSGLSSDNKDRFRIYVDRFELIGVHDLNQVSDADFYGNKGGGGSRVKVLRSNSSSSTKLGRSLKSEPGEMVQRLVWLRKNHSKFRDPVWHHWEGKCAVTDDSCNGLLVASHIKPWCESEPKEQTDFNNGLLLSSPLDALFDRGLIGFDKDGLMLTSRDLSTTTKKTFALTVKLQLRRGKITQKMKDYLKWHSTRYSLS